MTDDVARKTKCPNCGEEGLAWEGRELRCDEPIEDCRVLTFSWGYERGDADADDADDA